ncbi:OmpA family protein [Paucibacter sp. B2R-40]|uniref:OmpA family protein n=1 Tax=Paucibacter sp. B2R-40 TaxID=2893554 RepID=UPI0021E514AC|nr:OmpA family protein [Paucibacter sp. B2R-40]MCV2356459.1 OmpA family protein [Paucibacter sp. B2R-40]
MKSFAFTPKTSSLLLSSLLLGACASTPPAAPPALVEARQAVLNAEADPMVRTHAPLELKTATDSLSRANALLAKGDAGAELDSSAYVANSQARRAVAVALAKSNDAALTGSEAERERARADQRTAELQRSRNQTGIAQRQAAAAEQASGVAVAAAVSAQAQTAQAQTQLQAQQAELAALQAQKTERGMLVTLGDVLFELNRAEVKPAAQQSLRKLAEFLQQYPNRQVLIEGHTDSSGGTALNEALSLRRADAVKAALLAAGNGLAATRIATVGHGESFPVVDNASASNRALNRRVEIYVSENEQPVRPRR